ncbi:glycosyl transferase, group 1 family protein [Serinicoccus hydrothermalis]|uniref:Glycosyl transferase, group 1 family protein n=1 Tax=Serinicoccus hydrothermalis TaxID=1758689 RepID=A0A1B1NCX1_9MICO|nr:glycosyltransferase family 4 protein [Serinicoccus hydrothermalis]ANS79289.1 glycosyl transferase, group 1 family protein [Serinicoccus hydrothermalis]
MPAEQPDPRPAPPGAPTGGAGRRVVVVARYAAELDEMAPRLRTLTEHGHRVVLVWAEGEPGPALRSFGGRVRLQGRGRGRGARQTVRRALRPPPTAWIRDRGVLARGLRRDLRARRTVHGADLLLPVGAEAVRLFGRPGAAPVPVLTQEGLDDERRLDEVWASLRRRSRAGGQHLDPEIAHEVLAHVARTGGRVPARHQPLLVPLVEALHATGEYALAHQVVSLLPDGTSEPAQDALRHGLRQLVEVSRTGRDQPGTAEAVRGLLEVADAELSAVPPDVDTVTRATTLALQLLFHRELHADTTSSPLVTGPDAFLADWRASRVGRLLADPVPQAPVLERAAGRSAATRPDPDGHGPRVVVVPGSYPQFAVPVRRALADRAQVHLAELRTRDQLRGLGTRRELVAARLGLALGTPWVPDYELLEELEAADALFVDWADRGSLAAVMSAPAGVRVTLRIHSMDAFSPWIHLLDWSRVDVLVLVSEHLRTMVRTLLGDRLAGTEVRVVPNLLDPGRIPTGKVEGHRRRLLMVGWAQRVKDPLWAVEVLALLRQEDPEWSLTLVGTDFPDGSVVSQGEYARAFRERITQDDVRGAVRFVGFTRDLAPHLAASGFVLSTSRRESFGLALVEGAASGAVPVVRDWPVFAPLDGARGLFGDDWVVDTVAGAADRIRALAEEPGWSAASDRARAVVEQRFTAGPAGSELVDLILGSAAGQPRAMSAST